ncbi:unnamed protein product [Cylicocyclus nassatus]|uniref:Uncharacterized protein n=1 Tax=Cylicocyclus nassatus TaxID=53992 RepID=A0AA36GMY5_CYLNA|nr:unnamed protein product [Cylicocyclus nassatus]
MVKFVLTLIVLLCVVVASEALSCQLGGNRLCSVSCAIQGRKKGGHCEWRYVKSEKRSRQVCVCN